MDRPMELMIAINCHDRVSVDRIDILWWSSDFDRAITIKSEIIFDELIWTVITILMGGLD